MIIQIFQLYVVKTLPETNSISEEFLQGRAAINIWRSLVLLLSFIPLIYTFLIICSHNLKYNFALTIYAFLGLFMFCFLEITIRSIELFYTQLILPSSYLQATNLNEKKVLLDNYSAFQSVQYALYFPLMLTQAIGSIILSIIFSNRQKVNLLLKTAFALNAIRLAGRLIGMFLHINWFDSFSGSLYLPSIIIIYGLITVWLIKVKDEDVTGCINGAQHAVLQ
jgi:hypothetical protein